VSRPTLDAFALGFDDRLAQPQSGPITDLVAPEVERTDLMEVALERCMRAARVATPEEVTARREEIELLLAVFLDAFVLATLYAKETQVP
jgi:hypothetical protein